MFYLLGARGRAALFQPLRIQAVRSPQAGVGASRLHTDAVLNSRCSQNTRTGVIVTRLRGGGGSIVVVGIDRGIYESNGICLRRWIWQGVPRNVHDDERIHESL